MRISSPAEQRRLFHRGARRRGRAVALALIGIAAASCLVIAGWLRFGRPGAAEGPELLTAAVWRGPYDFTVTARGNLESASNVELICEVRSRSGGTPILAVVPEGTVVQAGDVVVELDDSTLLEEADQQKILISTRESLVAQAENTLKAAEIAKTEYLEGLYVSLEKQGLADLALAQQAKAAAEVALEATKVLYDKAVVSSLQLQAAYSNLDDAVNKLDGAQTNLDTLRNLTKPKESTLLDANIDSAEAVAKAQQRALKVENNRLKEIEKAIANCTIRAPSAGQVVYVNEPEYYRSSTYAPFVVAPGAMVRERQVIVWLPDPNEMQVKVAVNEARVTLVHPGMHVSIRIDAFDDEPIEGVVTKVNPFAEPTSYSSGNINKYGVTVKIKNPPASLRVGMSAEAWIHVEQVPDALQLPVQALAESQGRYFSLVKEDDEYETREVTISSVNDEVATIGRGLEEGDEVVINPRSARDLLKLPDATDPTPVLIDDVPPADAPELPGIHQVNSAARPAEASLSPAR